MPTYEVSVECTFTARHALRLPDGGLEPPHEHAWRVTATFRADRLDEPAGVVLDFAVAERALAGAAGELDGADLNAPGVLGGASPSAERVAEHLAGRLLDRLGGGRLHRLRVTEAPGCSAAFYPGAGDA